MKLAWILAAALASRATADPAAMSNAPATAASVVACMRANLPQAATVKDIELLATDRLGARREFKGKVYAAHLKRAQQDAGLGVTMKVLTPASLYGTAYLIRSADSAGAEDNIYMYLPGIQRMRRISGASANGALLGTNLSYSDFQQMETGFGGSQAVLEGADSIGQRQVYRLAFRPRPQDRSPYTLIRSWVDRQTCVPLSTAFYQGDSERKRFSASADALHQSGGLWYLSESVMRDLQDGSSTVIHIDGISGSASLPDSTFQPLGFYLGN
jgi:hypothetical protein